MMAKMIFVNLPVTDLAASMRFYEAVGFTNNAQFTNDQAASMMWSDTIYVMLLTHDFWKTFSPKTIPNAHEVAQVYLCLSHDSFMYGSSFEDPDGHIWENVYMDMSALPEGETVAEQPVA